jgi:O-antigen/teichoic acid export membrane protein
VSQERVSRGATFALLSQLVGGVLTAALTIFLSRRLSAQQLGAFTFALGVMGIAALFADLGISSSVSRFLAERRDRPAAAAALFRTALRLKLLVGVPATLILLLLAGPICRAFGTTDAVWAVRGCALALLAQTTFNMCLYAFVALGKIRYNVALTTIESLTEVGASIALVLLGGPRRAPPSDGRSASRPAWRLRWRWRAARSPAAARGSSTRPSKDRRCRRGGSSATPGRCCSSTSPSGRSTASTCC